MDVILKNVADIRHIGSIFSSSSFLSDRILEYADIENKSSIVEIGPGSGAFTKHILPTLHPTQTFFAIEKDMHLQQQLMKTLPDLQVYNGCASDIEIYMRDIGISSVDCIISSLPRALFENTLQNKLLSSLYDALEE
jgi:phospholipid N-methyltransferase